MWFSLDWLSLLHTKRNAIPLHLPWEQLLSFIMAHHLSGLVLWGCLWYFWLRAQHTPSLLKLKTKSFPYSTRGKKKVFRLGFHDKAGGQAAEALTRAQGHNWSCKPSSPLPLALNCSSSFDSTPAKGTEDTVAVTQPREEAMVVALAGRKSTAFLTMAVGAGTSREVREQVKGTRYKGGGAGMGQGTGGPAARLHCLPLCRYLPWWWWW